MRIRTSSYSLCIRVAPDWYWRPMVAGGFQQGEVDNKSYLFTDASSLRAGFPGAVVFHIRYDPLKCLSILKDEVEDASLK